VLNNVSQYLGGVAIVMKDFSPAPTRANLVQRLEYMRSDPSFSASALKRAHDVIIIDGTDAAVKTAVLVVYDPSVNLFEDEPRWRSDFAQQEWELVRAALTMPTVLASVNSFSPAVAATFRATAVISVVLSFLLILIYVWVRFGSVRYSMAAIAPLIHDVLAAIGMIAFAEILYEHVPAAAAIGIRPFKIDMGMVAAIMAIIGYSLNDTIIILDRIRENRGRLVHASKEMINRSVNQTLSRTLITTGTTVAALVVLFLFGGEGVASFSYALLCGMIIGTYSSIAVAAPIVYDRKAHKEGRLHEVLPDDDSGGAGEPSRLLP
jgi:SecD/SecF fusion protein